MKVITAVISARPELLHELYDSCGDELVSRFKEREENVRLDIINCFTVLVQATCVFNGNRNATAKTDVGGSVVSPPALIRQRSTVGQLESRVSHIVIASCTQLAGQSVKTKSAICTLLRALVTALNVLLEYWCAVLFSDDMCRADWTSSCPGSWLRRTNAWWRRIR